MVNLGIQSNSDRLGFGFLKSSSSSWLDKLHLPNVKFNIVSEHHTFYASEYSKLATTLSPVQALSALSSNRVELDRIGQARKNDLLEKGEELLVTNGNHPLLAIHTAYCEAINKRKLLKEEGETSFFIGEKEFKENITPHIKDTNKTGRGIYDLFGSAEFYFEIAWKLEPLENVISKVIGRDYPESIDQQLDKNEYQNRNKGGRPEDESVDQQQLKHKVKELVQLKRFTNKNGSPKPTTIRDEIINNHPEVAGEISARALFDRVKKALEELNMQ